MKNITIKSMERNDFKVSEKFKPGEDFYMYSNKYWIENNPMPSDKSRYAAFDKLHEENLERLMELIDKPSANLPIPLQMNIINLRDKYLERDYFENYSYFIEKYINKINKVETVNEALRLHARMSTSGVRFLFNISFDSDLKDCDNNIIYITQDGLSINKDYFEDEKILDNFKVYISNICQGINPGNVDLSTRSIIETEKEIASFSSTETQMRDTEMSYNIYTFEQLVRDFPEIPWIDSFEAYGIDVLNCGKICVGQPDFIKGLNDLLNKIKNEGGGLFKYTSYLSYCAADSFAPHLGEHFFDSYFDFYCKSLKGQEEPEPLEKRAYYFAAGIYSEAIGKKYIENYFDSKCKKDVCKIVENLKKIYSERIKKQSWMSSETKKMALEKLRTFKTKIGYPEKLKEYEWIKFNPQDCFLKIKTTIVKQIILHETEEKLGKPVDKDEWFMSPQTVNAYYNPTTNEICFPAGILQFPFYDKNAYMAWNYGGIGAVIGHEMTHGFDDQGRLFDKEGNMENWWKDEDIKNFKEITDKFVNFWNSIEILPGLNANGELSLGENLADHGGVRIALEAWKKYGDGTKEGLQEFFLAYSANWAGSIKEEEMRRRTIEDVHSLGEKRVNACLQHFDEWYEAFDITESDPMYIPKENRLNIW